MTTAEATTPAQVMAEGRRADSNRRRERVLTALAQTAADSCDINVSAIARSAGVDQTFLYRHRDLLAQLHALQAQPPNKPPSSTVSRVSLQTDLHAAQHHAARLTARVHQLERRLSQLMGEQTWQQSGLGSPDDIDQLHQRITSLEAETADLRIQLEERADELAAARLANRELMTRINATPRT